LASKQQKEAMEQIGKLFDHAMFTEMADWIYANWSSAHRRALKVGKLVLMFGNDGVGDPAVTAELEYVFRWLRKRGHLLVGFGTCSDHFTWVLIVRPAPGSNPEQEMDDMLWDAWKHGAEIGLQTSGDEESWTLYSAPKRTEALRANADRLPELFSDWLSSAKFRGHKKTTTNYKPVAEAKKPEA
jgi:hypothetical protein